jgi:threonyl-tRNA synthetase
MEYIDVDGSKRRPYIIHRTSIGCYERTLALLLEKYAGALPCWLMPTQVVVMPITDRTAPLSVELSKKLEDAGIRVETDLRSEKIGYKIRAAQLEKIPYMLVIGDKEAENGVVAVRSRSGGDLGTMTFEAFLSKILTEIHTRAKS